MATIRNLEQEQALDRWREYHLAEMRRVETSRRFLLLWAVTATALAIAIVVMVNP